MADNSKFVQIPPTTLSGSGATSTVTTIELTSLKDVDAATVAMTDFGSIGYATIEPGGTKEEIISFTGITQNADGTATLTSVTRGLQPKTPYTSDDNYKQSHSGGKRVVFSNNPQFYDRFANKNNDETISGSWSFPTPTSGSEAATKDYADGLALTPGLSYDRVVVAGTAGETVAAGELVYFDTTDNEWKLTDADTASTVDNVLLGIAQGAGTDGNAITGGVLTSGVDSNQTGMTAGDIMYASNTAGAISSSAGTTEVTVGIAKSATELYFYPGLNQKITEDIQDALAGTSGTPSGTNKFVTDSDGRLGIKSMTAGATINGATLPVPVYQNDSDNEFYACDANDTSAMKFLGFATSNGTDGAAMDVQFTGIVDGFTGLSEGEKYFVQDTVGTIGTSPGTYEILAGIAISETELLIQKGKRYASGTATINGTATSTVTVGFRVSKVLITASFSDGGQSCLSTGSYVNGTNRCSYIHSQVTDATDTTYVRVDTDSSWHIADNLSGTTENQSHQGVVDTVTDTTFRLNQVKTSSAQDIVVQWVAEGEL